MNKIRVKSTSFEINKLITTTQLFSKVELSISARLVLRCIIDYWNFNIGCAYPTQLTISKCTGLTEVAVGKAVKELDNKGLLDKKKMHKRIYYYLTLKLLGLLDLTPKIIYTKSSKKTETINKINQETNQTNTNDDFVERATPEQVARIFVKHFSDKPQFAQKVKKLKEEYNIVDY